MTFHRPWLPLFVAGCLFSGLAEAQQDAGGAAAPAAGGSSAGGAAAGSNAAPGAGSSAAPGASSAFGTAPSTPASGTNPNAPSEGAVPYGTQKPPGQGGQGTQNGATPDTSPQASDNPAGGSASAFGSTEKPGASQLQQAPATFSVPGFYGRGPQNYVVGEGRLARPRFRFSGNISVGYDDNVFQTPTHGLSVPTQKVQVLETPGSPAGTVQVLVPSGDPNVPDAVQNVQVPAVAPKFRNVTIPGVPAAQRIASWITRTDAKWDVQFADRRTLFTFDLGGGLDYYWDRPGKKEEGTGNLSMVYLRRLTGRAQFTAEVDASYQSQPDFSQPNVPTSSNLGSYLTANAKADFSYRLTPRFSTVTSVSYNTLQYQDAGPNADNFATTTFGTELRYLFSPRLTLLGELRYSSDTHEHDSVQDSNNYYLLIGGELALSRRFSATLRVGEVVQKFKEGGSSESSPYVEGALNYRITQQTILSWNVRYGYEEAGAGESRNLTARSGIQLTQIFTPRFQGVLGVNLIRQQLTSDFGALNAAQATNGLDGSDTGAVTSTGNRSTKSVQDTIDTSLGFYYTLDRHWSLNLTYTYTTALGPDSTSDYYRQRIFLGAAYQF